MLNIIAICTYEKTCASFCTKLWLGYFITLPFTDTLKTITEGKLQKDMTFTKAI